MSAAEIDARMSDSAFSRRTRAQEFRDLVHRLGVKQNRISAWLGVTENTVSRWMTKARADDECRRAKRGLEPERCHVLHLRALLALQRTCPAMLPRLAWGSEGFDRAMASVYGRPLGLLTDREPGEYQSLGDGADEGEE